jgi:PTH2 family peptidyl-tRNA hydrolase
MNEPKQIIVVRKDLRNTKGEKIRCGKIASQVAHASLGAILNYVTQKYLYEYTTPKLDLGYDIRMNINKGKGEPTKKWLEGSFTKICVSVNSEQELLDIYNKALESNINVKLIQDNGLTEFGGVKTYTCLALGPDYPEVLDPLTKHLPLL